MKVSEAIELLSTLPPNATLVLASDEEGNDFHELADFGYGWWEDEEFSSWAIKESYFHRL